MDSLWGTVEMLLLEVISKGASYGYEISQTVMSRSGGFFSLKEGSLYPALHRLEQQKLLKSVWKQVEGRRRKYYELTARGLDALAEKKQAWQSYAKGVEGVIGASLVGGV